MRRKLEEKTCKRFEDVRFGKPLERLSGESPAIFGSAIGVPTVVLPAPMLTMVLPTSQSSSLPRMSLRQYSYKS